MLKGIDISNWQGAINYDVLKDSIDFIIIKTTESNNYVDAYLRRNQSEARRVGLLRGYYHFARPAATSPEVQADYFVDNIGTLQDGEVLVLDYEIDFPGDTDAWCWGFLERVKARTGVKPFIYLNQSLANMYPWTRVISGDYGLWLAQYDGSQDGVNNTPWSAVAMKQYTSSGAVSGVNGNIDLDSFFGDANEFKKYGYSGASSSPAVINEGVVQTQGLPAHNEPNLSSSWEWYYDNQEHVTLLTKTVGELVSSGPYAPSRWWYQTDKGWISDAYVATLTTPPQIPDYVAALPSPVPSASPTSSTVDSIPPVVPVVPAPPAVPESPDTPSAFTAEELANNLNLDWKYRVVDENGKQLGVYSIEPNAYNTWLVDSNRKGKILDKNGVDVTQSIVDKSAPPAKAAAEGSKETVRLAIIGGISYLVSLSLNVLIGLPSTELTVILTLILKGIDKYLHENPNINLKGLIPF